MLLVNGHLDLGAPPRAALAREEQRPQLALEGLRPALLDLEGEATLFIRDRADAGIIAVGDRAALTEAAPHLNTSHRLAVAVDDHRGDFNLKDTLTAAADCEKSAERDEPEETMKRYSRHFMDPSKRRARAHRHPKRLHGAQIAHTRAVDSDSAIGDSAAALA